MKKQFSLFLVSAGIVVGSIGMVGCSTGDVNAQEVTQEVEVTEESHQIDVFGKVEAATIRDIAVDFPATVESIDIKLGDSVGQGTKMIRLDYESYKSEILKKEQAVQLLKVERSGYYNSLDAQSVEITQINKELKTKEAQLTQGTDADILQVEEQIKLLTEQIGTKEKDYEVNKSLVEAGALAKQDLKNAESQLTELKSEKLQAENRLKQLKTNKQLEVESLKGSIATKQTQASNTSMEKANKVESIDIQIQAAEIELNEMKERLNKAYLKEDAIILEDAQGVIYEIPVTEGTRLKGGESIVRLINPSKLDINVDVPESFINKIKVGNQADITLTASSDEVIGGKVTRIAQAARLVNGENMIRVELEVTDHQEMLKQGYEVSASIYY